MIDWTSSKLNFSKDAIKEREKKVSHRMGENIHNPHIWEDFYLEWRTFTTQ